MTTSDAAWTVVLRVGTGYEEHDDNEVDVKLLCLRPS